MNTKEVIKELDHVTLIEFKNYLIEHLIEDCLERNSNSKVISSYKKQQYHIYLFSLIYSKSYFALNFF